MADSTFDDQVKAAERDKYLAEAAKANAEKEKIEFELSESKRFFNTKTIWSVILGVGFLGFFINYVVVPTFNKENIELETKNAITQDSIQIQKRLLRNKIDSLNKQIGINRKISDKNNALSDNIKKSSITLSSFQKKNDSLQKAVVKSKSLLISYNKEILIVKPLRDSLKNLRETQKLLSSNSHLTVLLVFSNKEWQIDGYINPVINVSNSKGKIYKYYPETERIFAVGIHPWNETNFDFIVPWNKNEPDKFDYNVTIKSQKYKLQNDRYHITFNQENKVLYSDNGQPPQSHIKIDLIIKN